MFRWPRERRTVDDSRLGHTVRPAALKVFGQLQTGLVRVVGSLLQLGLILVLARITDTSELGRFLSFVAITNLGTAIGGGMPALMLRVASTTTTHGTTQAGWLWRHSVELSLLFSAAAAVFAATSQSFLRDTALAVGGLLVQRLSSAVVKATGHPNLGVLLDTALPPLVVMVSALCISASVGTVSGDALRLSYTAAVWATATVGVILTWRGPASLRTAWSAPWRTTATMYAEIGTITLGSAAQVVTANAPLALAPLFLSDAQTGVFGLALRVAGFASTILMSLAAYFGPAFARADTAAELRQLRRQSQYACLVLYLPVPVAFLMLPTEWLESISPGLGAIKGLVLVLSVGYFANAATGLAPTLLIMKGWVRSFSYIRVAAAALTVGAVLIGGALAGAMGIAVGSSLEMAVENMWLFGVSSRCLRTTDFAIRSSAR
jgi:O-antigen/teichoic acid export membrane protein